MDRGDLSDAEWELIGPLLPPERGRHARPAGDNRRYLNGMLHVLRVGCPWRDMHERYGKWNSVYVRFRRWAEQGVLLLNTSLTVEAGRAGSHAGWGWEALTDALAQAVVADAGPRVVMLWGAHAHRKAPLLQAARQASGHPPDGLLVLQSNHPSPLSATRGPVPFMGCGHFGVAQRFLQARERALSWQIPSVHQDDLFHT